MIRSRWSKWLSGVGGVVLIGGLVLANYGAGVTSAEAHHDYKNPFKQIMSKLNLILEDLKALKAGGGGAPLPSTGGAAGNQTLRWDSNLSTTRFTTAFPGAVLDNNTGLVWEQAPSTIPSVMGTVPVTTTWTDARIQCLEKNVGGTRGWRLPSVVELASLIDPDPVTGKPITQGVFTGVQSATYWSATTNAAVNPGASSTKFLLSFADGTVGLMSPLAQGFTANFWCVRGPMSESAY